jgi:hypothetical protein
MIKVSSDENHSYYIITSNYRRDSNIEIVIHDEWRHSSFQEVRRGLGEQLSLKIWWLLTTAAQVDGTSLMFFDVFGCFFCIILKPCRVLMH